MKPLKALTGIIRNLPELYLHILLTEEDEVVVARCLDFSVSSHGENEDDALASLSDSIADYLDYALRKGAFDKIVDPDEESLWNIFREQKLRDEAVMIAKNAAVLKSDGIYGIYYA